MMKDFYKLGVQAFCATPDPQFWYAGESHREALASVLYALQAGRGFAALIAKPGMGKTTLLFNALKRLKTVCKPVFLFQTIREPEQLLEAFLSDLGISVRGNNLIQMQARLNEACVQHYQAGKRVVLMIDEAQSLDPPVLEFVRMLSNFETCSDKLLQIVLSGQPQLAVTLGSPEMKQLRQRIAIFASLRPLSDQETVNYVDHRLRVAGCGAAGDLFTPPALQLIANHSEGIPRNINNLCFNAISLACATQRREIDEAVVREVMSDLGLERFNEPGASAPAPQQGRPKELSTPSVIRVLPPHMPLRKVGNSWPILLRFATISAAFLALALVAIRATREKNPGAAAKEVSPAAQTSNPSDPPLGPRSMVTVEHGQTLWMICARELGSCSATRINAIQRMNPQLEDLDHIETGQTLRMPVAIMDSRK
jgi:type II secretory pathway predicted ATPase ExeA